MKIEMPQFSWERPMEEQIIEFCDHMAQTMRRSQEYNKETGWFANNSLSDRCGAAAMAYETVAKKVKQLAEYKV